MRRTQGYLFWLQRFVSQDEAIKLNQVNLMNCCQTHQIIKQVKLHSNGNTPQRGTEVISVGTHCVWAAIGNAIHIFSSKVHPIIEYIFLLILIPVANENLVVTRGYLAFDKLPSDHSNDSPRWANGRMGGRFVSICNYLGCTGISSFRFILLLFYSDFECVTLEVMY